MLARCVWLMSEKIMRHGYWGMWTNHTPSIKSCKTTSLGKSVSNVTESMTQKSFRGIDTLVQVRPLSLKRIRVTDVKLTWLLSTYKLQHQLNPVSTASMREARRNASTECITLACLVCAIDWRWKNGRGSLFVTRACVYCELLTNQITWKGCKTTLSQICAECRKEFATQMCISNALIHWRKCSHLLDKIRVTDVTSFLSLLTTQASWNKCNTLHHACLLAVCDWRWKKWWGHGRGSLRNPGMRICELWTNQTTIKGCQKKKKTSRNSVRNVTT